LGLETGNNGYGTTFIAPFDKTINNAWVNIKDAMLSSFGIAGEFDISLAGLIDLFGEYKKHYSRYDDKFEYSFYSKAFKCYVIAYNLDKNIPQNYKLGNIKVIW
jgi:hypothetical protein